MATGTWIFDGSDIWSNSARWSGTIADGAGFTANFTNNITATRTVTLNTSRTIGNLTFSDAGGSGSAWVLTNSSSSTLTLSGGSTPVLNVSTPTTINGAAFNITGTQGFIKSGSADLQYDAQGSTLTGTIIISTGVLATNSFNVLGVSTNVFPTATAYVINGDRRLFNGANAGYTITAPISGSGLILNTNSSTATAASNTVTFADLTSFTGILALWQNQLTQNIRSFAAIKKFPTSSANILFDNGAGAAVSTQITTLTIPADATAGTYPVNFWIRSNSFVSAWAMSLVNNMTSGAMTFTGDLYRSDASGSPTLTFTLDGTNTNANTISGFVRSDVGASALAIAKAGAGTWVFSNANTYTGGTNVSGGILRGSNATAFGTGSVTASGGAVELTGGNTYTNAFNTSGSTIRNVSGTNVLSGTVTMSGATTLGSTAGSLSLTNASAMGGSNIALTLGEAGDSGSISITSRLPGGTASITKVGGGTSTLLATDSAGTGATTINAGVLEAKVLANSGSNSSIGAGVSIAFGTGSTGFLKYTGTAVATTNRGLSFSGSTAAGLDSSATNEFNSTTFSGSITPTGTNTFALKGSNTGYNTLSGTVIGGHGFAKTEAGRWILKGANDLTGTTTVSAGRLVASNTSYGNKLLGGSVIVQAGGEIQLSSEGDQKGRCAYTNLTVGGTSGNPAKIRIGGTATSPTVYLNGDLALPTGTDKTNWDLTGDTFKAPGTYTLFVFSGVFGVTGGTVASNVLATYPTGRSGVLSYNVGSPNTITVTIS